jgi:hypothetical protein
MSGTSYDSTTIFSTGHSVMSPQTDLLFVSSRRAVPGLLALLLIVTSGRTVIAGDDAGSVAKAPAAVRPLLIGTEVPDVTLQTVDGADVFLREQTGNKPTIIVFYRGGW